MAHSEISYLIACSLSLPNFRFLIPLGHYISKRSTSYGSLWNLTALASSFLLNFFLQNKRWQACLETLLHECGREMNCQKETKGTSSLDLCTNPIHGGSALLTVSLPQRSPSTSWPWRSRNFRRTQFKPQEYSTKKFWWPSG